MQNFNFFLGQKFMLTFESFILCACWFQYSKTAYTWSAYIRKNSLKKIKAKKSAAVQWKQRLSNQK